MTWWDGPLCGFDVETTGVDVDSDRIVVAAIAVIDGLRNVTQHVWVVNPGVEIPAEATEVHGITTEHVREHGARPDVALRQIVGCLAEESKAGTPIVAFNARFDLTVLDREARRHGVEPWTPRRVIDPLVLDKHLHRYRKGSRKLDAICEHMGARLERSGEHTPGEDALAACRAAWVIGNRGEVVRRVRNLAEMQELDELQREWVAVREDADALHEAQVKWAAAQAESLEAYFREQGKDEVVEPSWPVVPVREEKP